MSLFWKIKLILSIVIIISGLIFILSLVQRENDLLNIYYSLHKVCQLHKIDGAFYLINGTICIFSGGYFWILGDQFNIEDKTPKSISSVWPQFNGKLLHAFNYNNNAYMIVNNSSYSETNRRKEEVFVVKYNPLRIKKVAQNLQASNIPYVKCFDAITGEEMCFYVPELTTYVNNTNMFTTIKNDCLHKNSCAAVTFVGPDRLDAPTFGLRQNSFVLGESYLPIQFDTYLEYRNDIIAIFLDHYYCVKRLSCPHSCRWKSYSNHFCQMPKDFDVVFPVIGFGFGTLTAIIIVLYYRAYLSLISNV